MNTGFYNLCIATPMYNAAKYVDRLAKSISEGLNEYSRFQDDEEITWYIYNDGSTDDTESEVEKAIKRYHNLNIVYSSGRNRGLTFGRNFLSEKFVNAGVYSHMIFIDADDYFNPGWLDTICYWLLKVHRLFPDEKPPYLCFKYWNDRDLRDECQIYTKLNTRYKAHAAQCQYENGGFDVLHVIPRDYLIEVKELDGNYYHVCKGEKWTPDCHNFLKYTDYPASFISDMVASLGSNDGNMSDSYYNNVVTKYAKGQVDEIMMFLDTYGRANSESKLGFDLKRVPWFRWRWYLKCLVRMIQNGTLVFSDKKWDDYVPDESTIDSKHEY